MFKQSKMALMVALSLASSSQVMAAEEAATLDDLVVTGTRAESPLLEQAGNTGKVSQEEIDIDVISFTRGRQHETQGAQIFVQRPRS